MKEPVLYRVVRPFITFLFKVVYRPVVVGKEHLCQSGGMILAGNHTNNFDCLLLVSSTKRTIHFLAKDELCKGIKKIIFLNMGIIPVNRKEKNPKVLSTSECYLKEEKVIGIFPEGTYPKGDKHLLPFKIGAVKMAKDTHTPIVPFAIIGSYKPFLKKIKIVFGKPYMVSSENLEKENQKLREIILNMIGGES